MWYGLKASLEVPIHLGRMFAGYASAPLPKLHYVSPMTEDSPNVSLFSPHWSVSFGTRGFLLFPENHPAFSHPSYQISQCLTLPISDSFHCSHFPVRNAPWVFFFPPLCHSLWAPTLALYAHLCLQLSSSTSNFQWNDANLLIIPSSMWIQAMVVFLKLQFFSLGCHCPCQSFNFNDSPLPIQWPNTVAHQFQKTWMSSSTPVPSALCSTAVTVPANVAPTDASAPPAPVGGWSGMPLSSLSANFHVSLMDPPTPCSPCFPHIHRTLSSPL